MHDSPPKEGTAPPDRSFAPDQPHAGAQELPHSSTIVGSQVHARGRRFQVREIERHPDCHAVRLAGLDETDDLVLLTPFDRLQPVGVRDTWRRASMAATFVAAARVIVDSVGLRRLASAAVRSPSLRLLDWQFTAVQAIRDGQAARVLIADAVGLGKTVQAGLVHAALSPAPECDRTLIVAPAGLRDQWQTELHRLLALAATVVDSARLRQLRSGIPPAVNPWTLPGVFVTTIDFIKQPDVLAALLDVRWRLVVFDEAHALTGHTDRHRAAHLVARTAHHVVLLTATPHSGDPGAFDRLCRIGETRGDEPLLLRRTRADAGLPSSRRVRTLAVAPSPAERGLHTDLHAYIARIRREGLMAPESARLAAWVLIKRAASSVRALRLTLIRRRAALAGDPGEPAQQPLPFAGHAGETGDEDDWLPQVLEAPGMHDRPAEIETIARLIACAEAAEPHDRKMRVALRMIRRLREPVLVFTEYRDTLRCLVDGLSGPATTVLHGGMLRAERRESERAFAAGDARVMVATDTASEGLNLHHTCRIVINVDVPWNPTRLEQRIGRVDRIGQRRPVRALTLTSKTAESPLVRRMQAKLRHIEADLSRTCTPEAKAHAPSDLHALLCHAVGVLGAAGRHQRLARDAAAADPAKRLRLPWARLSPRARRRLALPPGVLLLYRTVAVAGAGCATACVAVVVELDAGVVRRCRPRALIAGCTKAAAAVAGAHTAAALERSLAAHARYSLLRRHRLQATLDAEVGPAPFQPGLFDRRAIAAALERRRAASARLDALRHVLAAGAGDRDAGPGDTPRPVAALILR